MSSVSCSPLVPTKPHQRNFVPGFRISDPFGHSCKRLGEVKKYLTQSIRVNVFSHRVEGASCAEVIVKPHVIQSHRNWGLYRS